MLGKIGRTGTTDSGRVGRVLFALAHHCIVPHKSLIVQRCSGASNARIYGRRGTGHTVRCLLTSDMKINFLHILDIMNNMMKKQHLTAHFA